MNDQSANLGQLREIVRQFVHEREWQKFHAPKNIAMALSIEAAELMEHFQWIDTDSSRREALTNEQIAAIGEEISDVFTYCLAIANELGLDLTETFEKKMIKNRLKYPVADFRGKF
jgi:NTP pyrophosphatase (non-canonical NTP hydrolase)